MASRPIPSLKTNKQHVNLRPQYTKQAFCSFEYIESHPLIPAGLSPASHRSIHNIIRHKEKCLKL